MRTSVVPLYALVRAHVEQLLGALLVDDDVRAAEDVQGRRRVARQEDGVAQRGLGAVPAGRYAERPVGELNDTVQRRAGRAPTEVDVVAFRR